MPRCGPSASTAADVSAPTWPATHGTGVERRVGEREPEVGGATGHRVARGQRERSHPERRRIDAEHEVVHDRVADDHDVEHPVAWQAARRIEQVTGEVIERGADRFGQLVGAAFVHHHVRDAAHQVLAEADLRVHLPGAGDDVAAEQLAEVPGDRRRADVDGDAVRRVDEAGPDRHGTRSAARNGRGQRRRWRGAGHGAPPGRTSVTVTPCWSASATVTRSLAALPDSRSALVIST